MASHESRGGIEVSSFMKTKALEAIQSLLAKENMGEIEINDCKGFFVASELKREGLVYLDSVTVENKVFYICQKK